MKVEILSSAYNTTSDPIRSLNYKYLNQDDCRVSPTETGSISVLFSSVINLNDGIFSQLPREVVEDSKVQPFLMALHDAYEKQRNPNYTYLPLEVAEHGKDGIILDWIYETVRISFFFMNDKNLYSVSRYDAQHNSYSQKIEDMAKERYKEIASQVLSEIA